MLLDSSLISDALVQKDTVVSTMQRRLVRGNTISGDLSEFRNRAKHSTKPLTPGYSRTVQYLPGHMFPSDDSLMSTPWYSTYTKPPLNLCAC